MTMETARDGMNDLITGCPPGAVSGRKVLRGARRVLTGWAGGAAGESDGSVGGIQLVVQSNRSMSLRSSGWPRRLLHSVNVSENSPRVTRAHSFRIAPSQPNRS